MWNLLLIGVVSVVFAAGSAIAADMPVKAPVTKAPVMAPIFSWTGFYIGGHAGYAWGRSKTEALAPDALDCGGIGTCPETISHNTHGAFGGLHAGYNLQVNSAVFGIELEGGYLDAKGSTFSALVPDHFVSAKYGAYGALTGSR